MKKKSTFTTAVLLAVLLVGLTACEDSDITAPEGSTITLTPTPQFVLIDRDAGETEGQTSLVAQLTDAGGLPIDGVPLFFTSDGGLLGSATNICPLSGQCSRTPQTACDTDEDCPVVPGPPDVRNTNANGIVSDVLKIRLDGDPDVVNVSVQGTNLGATASVTKNVFDPIDAVAVIGADPSIGQRNGLFFSLDGGGSTTDPQRDLTCFDWSIEADIPVFAIGGSGCAGCTSGSCSTSCAERGSFASLLTLKVGTVNETVDSNLTVRLKVSDKPNLDCANAEEEDFSIFEGSVNYAIRCDLTDPTVNAGNSQSGSLADAPTGRVDFTLTAVAEDPESPELSYLWTCPNASTIQPPTGEAQSVTCTYTTTASDTATLSVTNSCGRVATDSVVLTVNQ